MSAAKLKFTVLILGLFLGILGFNSKSSDWRDPFGYLTDISRLTSSTVMLNFVNPEQNVTFIYQLYADPGNGHDMGQLDNATWVPFGVMVQDKVDAKVEDLPQLI